MCHTTVLYVFLAGALGAMQVSATIRDALPSGDGASPLSYFFGSRSPLSLALSVTLSHTHMHIHTHANKLTHSIPHSHTQTRQGPDDGARPLLVARRRPPPPPRVPRGSRGSLPQNFEGRVTKFAQHKALKLIARVSLPQNIEGHVTTFRGFRSLKTSSSASSPARCLTPNTLGSFKLSFEVVVLSCFKLSFSVVTRFAGRVKPHAHGR